MFIASFISGSVLNQLPLLLSNPEKVLSIIGTGQCKQAHNCQGNAAAFGLVLQHLPVAALAVHVVRHCL